jgi:hypothetical protein
MNKKQKENKKLISYYPFLLPRNRWTDEVPDDYDYSYTELDNMPDAWKDVFGLFMCEYIKQNLMDANYLDKYRIMQIKEKYGTLRWYDNGVPKSIYDKHCEIISKYEKLSGEVCFDCGAEPTVGQTRGWILFLCEKCGSKQKDFVRFKKLIDVYKDEVDNESEV